MAFQEARQERPSAGVSAARRSEVDSGLTSISRRLRYKYRPILRDSAPDSLVRVRV